ncbi:hypothetical protein ASF11_09235 [Acidovorax sp. Leaf76]|uniref:hypothetical protein n=1 Tax=unclassified Acidovorax TaxID=2684926 RepID=UPI0006F949EC|nr:MULTISPECIES: hypothetical protein [unclassified Acidovorax]KQO16359.1 hypothetical protein ASF11_09235 [Acidovorax sp. Leaf76]KQO32426.1 hypothetical protein ASF19_08065 [Acidovorax sp. Leaf84]KQS31993.1 hypothetical protein ASG27_08355 [Acidovorax sp. Leaf191]
MTSGSIDTAHCKTSDRVLELLLSLDHGADLDLLDDREVLAKLLASPEQQEVAAKIRLLLEAYVYEQSLEFNEAASGKSAVYKAYLTKQAAQPLRRNENSKRFRDALRDLLESDRIFQLLPNEANPDVVEVRRQLNMLNLNSAKRQTN